ncbi:MAG: ChaN family lipoprotein, partial [Desulfatiglandales bacterium]|nr:ChaN family lipoprotein [Desulfatiglandales bacterium]
MSFRNQVTFLTVFMVFLTMQGCAGKVSKPSRATIPGVSGHFKVGQILDLKTGKVLSFDQLIDQIASKEIIFIGEVHDNPEHHLIQAQIIQALMGRFSLVTIAMEFFQKSQQPSLDRYLQRELTESEFLKEVDWKGRWGFDYHFYRPLVLSARQHGSRILAINAPNDIVKKVAREGLKGLDENERKKLPKEIDLSNKAHRAYLREIYEKHSHNDLKKFETFYEAQCVWEDTMAHNLAEHLSQNKRKLVVFTGIGHIVNK